MKRCGLAEYFAGIYEDDDNWEFESVDWARIASELFSWNRIRIAAQFFASALAFIVLYYPLMRGICWLILALAYWCGTDGAVWPGPYTPYPSDMSL